MCINLILVGAISYAVFDIIAFFRNIKDTFTCVGTGRNPEKKYGDTCYLDHNRFYTKFCN